jgi:hypothetical protein
VSQSNFLETGYGSVGAGRMARLVKQMVIRAGKNPAARWLSKKAMLR